MKTLLLSAALVLALAPSAFAEAECRPGTRAGSVEGFLTLDPEMPNGYSMTDDLGRVWAFNPEGDFFAGLGFEELGAKMDTLEGRRLRAVGCLSQEEPFQVGEIALIQDASAEEAAEAEAAVLNS